MAKQYPSDQTSQAAASIPRRKTVVERVISGCFASSIAIYFGGVGLLWVGMYTVVPVMNAMTTRSWVESPCVVLSSETQANPADEDSVVNIRYQYTFGGREFVGDRYNLVNGVFGSKSPQEIVDRYSIGAASVCYVNPAAPEESVLNREFAWNPTESFGGLLAIMVGLIALACRFQRVPTMSGSEIIAAKAQAKSKTNNSDSDFPSGATTLKPVFPPKRRFGIVLFFAVFWNGIVWVLLWNVFGGFRRPLSWSADTWLAILFFAPFVLIGLFALVGVVHNFMKLFGPRPILTLCRGQLPLGQSATLEWKFGGQSTAIRKLILSLRAQEWVRYGENAEDTSVFYRETLCEIDEPKNIIQGRIEITIPDNLMYSWDGGSNRIQWIVDIKGSVRGWSDIAEEFYLEVTPHEKAEH